MTSLQGCFIVINVDIGTGMINLKDYVTVKQAAEILGIAPLTVRRWDKAAKLRAYRNPVNNYRLYRKEELRLFLKKLAKSKETL